MKEHLDLVSNRVADTEIPAQIRELVKASLLLGIAFLAGVYFTVRNLISLLS